MTKKDQPVGVVRPPKKGHEKKDWNYPFREAFRKAGLKV